MGLGLVGQLQLLGQGRAHRPQHQLAPLYDGSKPTPVDGSNSQLVVPPSVSSEVSITPTPGGAGGKGTSSTVNDKSTVNLC